MSHSEKPGNNRQGAVVDHALVGRVGGFPARVAEVDPHVPHPLIARRSGPATRADRELTTVRSDSPLNTSMMATMPWHALGPGDEAAAAMSTSYLVLPSRDSPRWVIPAEPAAARRMGMALYAPGSPLGRIRKVAMNWALRLPSMIGSRRRVDVPGHPADGPLGPLLASVVPGRDWSMALALGTPGGAQKATGLVLGPAGQRLAIVKIEVRHGSRPYIEREAEMLRHLEGLQLAMQVPRLLACADTPLGLVLVQSVLDTEPLGSRIGRAHWLALTSLLDSSQVTIGEYAGHRRLARRWQDQEHSFRPQVHVACRTALDLILRSKHSVNGCVVHGDFAPWNIGWSERTGQIALYDWEYAHAQALPLLDAMHFVFQSEHLLRRCNARQIWSVLAQAMASDAARHYLAQARIDAASVPLLGLTYLLDKLLDADALGQPQDSGEQQTRQQAIAMLVGDAL